MAHTALTHETEVRHLPLFQKRELAEILEVQDAWKFLMSAITENESGEIKFKYSPRHITIIEREARAKPELRAAEILFEEWGTSGRKRPTLQNLMDTLAQLQLYRAADFVSMNILGGAPVKRLEINLPHEIQDVLHDYEKAETLPIEANPEQPECELVTIPYEELEDFCGWNYREQGKEQCIGVGAFACVFKASIPAINNGEAVAVKRFHSGNVNAPRQFEKELSALRDLNHRNIVRMLGLCEGEHKCLVLELMENGNLEDSLACKNRSTPLNWRTRIKIALDAAEGLKYLHSSRLIHRDIKSANILLDANCNAKLADFGLMQEEVRPAAGSADKEEDSDDEDASSRTEIAGTSCYMSPEALLYGKVSIKGDIFSFGVVLLELLTSLPADDDNRTIR
ncbi:Hypothetical predicted protein [Cloeon dipterum]|uniref:Protein kinase domain-containing protein n=1 Tax=Cloeon dipterum TaxID=197152 RepID=A0A8S1CB17_9INSE|nr:Hypothetical predicted protein [Cloeon dipterum]